MIILIGSNTGPRSGKDEVSNFFVKKGFIKKRFSTPVKAAVASLLDIDPNMLEDHTFKETEIDIEGLGTITVRDFLRIIAQGTKDIFGEDIFARLLKKEISGDTAICDLRFQVEYDTFNTTDSIFICVNKPGNGSSDSDLECKWDYVVENSGTLAELEEKLEEIWEKMKKED